MPLRVAFTGASGTGKTTLAKYVSEKYGIPYNPEGSRSAAERLGLKSPYDADFTCEQCGMPENTHTNVRHIFSSLRPILQLSMFRGKRDWESDHEEFVTDRHFLDQYVYASIHMNNESNLINSLEAKYKENWYSHVFYTPISSFFYMEGEGIEARKLDRTYQEHFDTQIAKFIREFPNVHVVNVTGVPDREKFLDEILG